jgi:YD repeat-containing protein
LPTIAGQTYAPVAGNDRVQKYTGPDGAKVCTYDARGLAQTLTVTPPNGAQSETWTFDYDAAGRSAHVTYPDGHVRAQLCDSEGRLVSRCYNYGATSYCYTASYDPAGNPQTMTDPYGGTDTYLYDGLDTYTMNTAYQPRPSLQTSCDRPVVGFAHDASRL